MCKVLATQIPIESPFPQPSQAASRKFGQTIISVITKHITACATRFNPFQRSAKPCRVFLALFPPDAFKTVKFKNEILPQTSKEPGLLKLTFSDGKEMAFDTEKYKIGDILEEVNRHTRLLSRKAELAG